LHSAGTWTVQKVDLIYLETFEMWCWRRMEKTVLLITYHEVLQGIMEEKYPTYTDIQGG